MQNPDPNQHDLSPYNKEQLEKIQREEERRKLWRKEMAENEELANHLKTIHPKVLEPFINYYLVQKNGWVENNSYYEKQRSNEGIEWLDPATSHLGIIQQKKLFDKQCLWRAEKITIDNIMLCCDFLIWQHNIFNCPFIEPVNEDDLENYIDFLQGSDQDPEMQVYQDWQDYEKMKTAYELGNNDITKQGFPAWYHYHNSVSNADILMALPDIRGEKEAFYTNICHAEMKAMGRSPQTNSPAEPESLSQYFEKPYLEWFVRKFETKEVIRLFEAHKWWSDKNVMENLLYDDLRTLFSADEVIAIDASPYWIRSIREAADKYRRKKIAQALPDAWKQYMLNIQTGISFPYDTGEMKKYEAIRKLQERTIIAGRIVNDEPADLNF